ncbi:MAG: flavodoxin domain-containing protein [Lachnospiraceae bacterium]|nr:flavodoxin domain-containing protein [Lachnospiraceae bacterium]
MNKAVVIYESKYGYTKRYAQWIGEALSCPVFPRNKFRTKCFSQYDTVIYGGGLYAGNVSGISLIVKNWKLLCSKNVILFTCGLANPADRQNTDHIKESLSRVLTPEMLQNIKMFHLRGGIDYSRLGLIHRTMIAMLRKMLLKKSPETLRGEDRLLLQTYGQKVDYTDRTSIAPLIAQSLSSPDNRPSS